MYVRSIFDSLLLKLSPLFYERKELNARIFVPAYLGPDYMDSVQVIWILSSIILAIGMSNVSGAQFLIGCNGTKYLAISYFTSAVFNITGNLFLIPLLDERGASITTCVAEWMVVFIQFWAVRRLMGRVGIPELIYKKLIAAAIMSAVIIPLYYFGINMLVLLMQIIVGAAVYFISLKLLHDSGLEGVLAILTPILHKNRG